MSIGIILAAATVVPLLWKYGRQGVQTEYFLDKLSEITAVNPFVTNTFGIHPWPAGNGGNYDQVSKAIVEASGHEAYREDQVLINPNLYRKEEHIHSSDQAGRSAVIWTTPVTPMLDARHTQVLHGNAGLGPWIWNPTLLSAI